MYLNLINIFKKKPHIANSRKIVHITRFFEKKNYGGIEEVIRQTIDEGPMSHVIIKSIEFTNNENTITPRIVFALNTDTATDAELELPALGEGDTAFSRELGG